MQKKGGRKKLTVLVYWLYLFFPWTRWNEHKEGELKEEKKRTFFYMIVMNYIHCSDTGVHISFPFPAIGKTLPANKC